MPACLPAYFLDACTRVWPLARAISIFFLLFVSNTISSFSKVVCFSKLCHDLITRPVKGVPPEAAFPNPGRGRALRAVRSAAGQEGVCFARPGCRSALV